jgi:hypothetical protein
VQCFKKDTHIESENGNYSLLFVPLIGLGIEDNSIRERGHTPKSQPYGENVESADGKSSLDAHMSRWGFNGCCDLTPILPVVSPRLSEI